ncbi:MAG: hypothetical protein HQ568_03270 [Calditrichaeota bacterium]|nr:hypothetical protein [Calditrichota bacterium]
MSSIELKYTGKGLYTISEISLLTNAKRWSVVNWIQSHLSQPYFGKIEGIYVLSFHDLIEALTIFTLREKKVSLQTIRKAHRKMQIDFNISHPFATNKTFTNGKDIWIEVGEEINDKFLLKIMTDQIELDQITKPLLDSIDYSDGLSYKWRPLYGVVIDPLRSFGQPIIDKYGIQTNILANAFKAEGSFEKAAYWYDVNIESVKTAYKYETKTISRMAA